MRFYSSIDDDIINVFHLHLLSIRFTEEKHFDARTNFVICDARTWSTCFHNNWNREYACRLYNSFLRFQMLIAFLFDSDIQQLINASTPHRNRRAFGFSNHFYRPLHSECFTWWYHLSICFWFARKDYILSIRSLCDWKSKSKIERKTDKNQF